MAERVATGTWVEIRSVALDVGARAPQVPDDTQRVPLEMRVKGFLAAPAAIGETACVETAAGRQVEGTLAVVNPGYEHGFGAPVPALLSIGHELRQMLADDERGSGS